MRNVILMMFLSSISSLSNGMNLMNPANPINPMNPINIGRFNNDEDEKEKLKQRMKCDSTIQRELSINPDKKFVVKFVKHKLDPAKKYLSKVYLCGSYGCHFPLRSTIEISRENAEKNNIMYSPLTARRLGCILINRGRSEGYYAIKSIGVEIEEETGKFRFNTRVGLNYVKLDDVAKTPMVMALDKFGDNVVTVSFED